MDADAGQFLRLGRRLQAALHEIIRVVVNPRSVDVCYDGTDGVDRATAELARVAGLGFVRRTLRCVLCQIDLTITAAATAANAEQNRGLRLGNQIPVFAVTDPEIAVLVLVLETGTFGLFKLIERTLRGMR